MIRYSVLILLVVPTFSLPCITSENIKKIEENRKAKYEKFILLGPINPFSYIYKNMLNIMFVEKEGFKPFYKDAPFPINKEFDKTRNWWCVWLDFIYCAHRYMQSTYSGKESIFVEYIPLLESIEKAIGTFAFSKINKNDKKILKDWSTLLSHYYTIVQYIYAFSIRSGEEELGLSSRRASKKLAINLQKSSLSPKKIFPEYQKFFDTFYKVQNKLGENVDIMTILQDRSLENLYLRGIGREEGLLQLLKKLDLLKTALESESSWFGFGKAERERKIKTIEAIHQDPYLQRYYGLLYESEEINAIFPNYQKFFEAFFEKQKKTKNPLSAESIILILKSTPVAKLAGITSGFTSKERQQLFSKLEMLREYLKNQQFLDSDTQRVYLSTIDRINNAILRTYDIIPFLPAINESIKEDLEKSKNIPMFIVLGESEALIKVIKGLIVYINKLR